MKNKKLKTEAWKMLKIEEKTSLWKTSNFQTFLQLSGKSCQDIYVCNVVTFDCIVWSRIQSNFVFQSFFVRFYILFLAMMSICKLIEWISIFKMQTMTLAKIRLYFEELTKQTNERLFEILVKFIFTFVHEASGELKNAVMMSSTVTTVYQNSDTHFVNFWC